MAAPKAPPAAIEELPPDQRPARSQRRLDPRLLGLGRRTQRLPLGQRHLARSAAWPPMGARLLGPVRQRLAMDVRLLGRRPGNRCAVFARAAGERRSRSQHRRALRRTIRGCPAVGCGSRIAMPGVPVTGPAGSRIGIGFPAHYVWAPRGYVFVDGYWDYSLGRRGVLFAPVSFSWGHLFSARFFLLAFDGDQPVGALPIVSSCGRITNTTISATTTPPTTSRPDSIRRIPITPANLATIPIFAHERWQHRGDGQWEQGVAADFQNRRDNVDARPPRMWAAQTGDWPRSGGHPREGGILTGRAPLTALSKAKPVRYGSNQSIRRKTKAEPAGQSVQQYRENGKSWKPGWRVPRRAAQAANAPATVKLPALTDYGKANCGARQSPRSAPGARSSQAGSRSRPNRERPSTRATATTHGEPAAAGYAAAQPKPQLSSPARRSPSPGRSG